MAVNGDEEPLVELESAGELLRQLPRAFQHLINDGRYLFGVSNQVVVSAHGQKSRYPPPPTSSCVLMQLQQNQTCE